MDYEIRYAIPDERERTPRIIDADRGRGTFDGLVRVRGYLYRLGTCRRTAVVRYDELLAGKEGARRGQRDDDR